MRNLIWKELYFLRHYKAYLVALFYIVLMFLFKTSTFAPVANSFLAFVMASAFKSIATTQEEKFGGRKFYLSLGVSREEIIRSDFYLMGIITLISLFVTWLMSIILTNTFSLDDTITKSIMDVPQMLYVLSCVMLIHSITTPIETALVKLTSKPFLRLPIILFVMFFAFGLYPVILVKLFNLPVVFAGVFTFYMASIQLFNNIWSILVIFFITLGITFGSYKLSYSIFKKKDL